MSGTSDDLRLFVTLNVRPEQFAGYLRAMQDELAGARGEPGNLGFDLFQDAGGTPTIHLFEHWASRAALEQDHARQPCYIHVRSLEARALTGEVEERYLDEVDPPQPRLSNAKSAGGGHVRALVATSADVRPLHHLDQVFADVAPAFRKAAGSRFFGLFRNRDNATERLFLETWQDADARRAGWTIDPARFLSAALDGIPDKRELRLTDLGNRPAR